MFGVVSTKGLSRPKIIKEEEMAYNKSNVIVGAATLHVDDAVVGWTSGGVSIEHEAEFYDVEVDQEPNAVKSFRIKESFKIKTNLTEVTMENIKLAWGLDQAIDGDTYEGYRYLPFGGSQEDLTEHTLDVYGKSPGSPSRQRRVHFFRVVAVEFGAFAMEKSKEQTMPVTFLALIDSTQPANKQIGYLKDQTVRVSTNLLCKLTVAS